MKTEVGKEKIIKKERVRDGSCHNRIGKGGEEKGRGVRLSNKNGSGEGKITKKGGEAVIVGWGKEGRKKGEG